MNLVFSFEELGSALAFDAAWFTPVCVRHSFIKDAAGGWSAMLGEFLKLLLVSPLGMSTAGAALQIGGESVTIFAHLHRLLSDGDGLRAALQWNGANGTKPCWRHYNVYKKAFGLGEASASDAVASVSDAVSDPDAGGIGYVDITCSQPHRFCAWSESEFRTAIDTCVEALRMHAEGCMSRQALEDVQAGLGFKATAEGMLADAALRPHLRSQEMVRYDWLHTFLADGVVNRAAWSLLGACEQHGVATQKDVFNMLRENWQFPLHRRSKGSTRHAKYHHSANTPPSPTPSPIPPASPPASVSISPGCDLWHLFNNWGRDANSESDTVKAGASDMLSLYSLLRHWCVVSLRGAHVVRDQRDAYLAACSAVDTILQAKRGGIGLADAGRRLRLHMAKHLPLLVKARGEQAVRPKHHWAFDIADQLCSDSFVFDCFVVERLHLRVKACAEHIKNTRRVEWSVLSNAVNTHVRDASKMRVKDGLVGHVARMGRFPSASISDNCQVKELRCSVGDFVMNCETCGQVVACCVEEGEIFVVADELQELSKLSQQSGVWAPIASRQVWRAAELSEVAAWQANADGTFLIVRM